MYTESKDDYLDEDPAIPSQRVVLLSILTPKTVNAAEGLDWSTIGIKFRGAFESEEAAQPRLKFLKKIDPYHHIFTAPAGRWCPIDDDESNAERVEYLGDDNLNNLMKKHKEHVDKVRDHDNERKETARRNAVAHNKRMAKRAKKLEKQIGKTTNEIVANEIISNDIDTMHGMSREEMQERIRKIKENENKEENIINRKLNEIEEHKRDERVEQAQQRLIEKQEQINNQKSTIEKLEEECRKVREQLELLK